MRDAGDKKNSGCELFAVFVLVLLLDPWLVILNGWAASVLWRWFVVPTFHVLPLTIPFAIGLGLTVRFAVSRTPSKADCDEPATSGFSRHVAHQLIQPLAYVGIGWVVRLFM